MNAFLITYFSIVFAWYYLELIKYNKIVKEVTIISHI